MSRRALGGRRSRSGVLAVVTVAALAALAGDSAAAKAPGRNGLIAFDTGDGAHSQIYTISPDGSGLRRLTDATRGHQATDPHWSADGRRIAYVDDRSGSPQIWVMLADGSRRHPITRGRDADYSSPSWSSDGRWLLVSRCEHRFGTCDVDVIGADGRGRRRLVGGYWHHTETAFSSDGRHIVYSSDEGGYDSRVWVARADGSHRRAVTPAALAGGRPDWSPTMGRLVFTCGTTTGHICTIGTDGRHLRRLTGALEAIFASYSPDGRNLVLRAVDARCHCNALRIMTVRGRHSRTLTKLSGVRFSDWGAR